MDAFTMHVNGRWAGRLKTAASFRVADWRVIAEALAALTAADVATRVASPTAVLARATRIRRLAAEPLPPAELKRLGRLVDIAANYHPFRPRCLPRSLALARLLARRGVSTDVRIGVRTEGGRLDAHAWVELDGRALNDSPTVHERFAALGDGSLRGPMAAPRVPFGETGPPDGVSHG